MVTDDCETDLEQLRWSGSDLLGFLCALVPYRTTGSHDFRGAQWCLGRGVWYPCDAYVAPYDTERKCRTARGSTVYVKFSVPEDGSSLLMIVSTHESQT